MQRVSHTSDLSKSSMQSAGDRQDSLRANLTAPNPQPPRIWLVLLSTLQNDARHKRKSIIGNAFGEVVNFMIIERVKKNLKFKIQKKKKTHHAGIILKI